MNDQQVLVMIKAHRPWDGRCGHDGADHWGAVCLVATVFFAPATPRCHRAKTDSATPAAHPGSHGARPADRRQATRRLGVPTQARDCKTKWRGWVPRGAFFYAPAIIPKPGKGQM